MRPPEHRALIRCLSAVLLSHLLLSSQAASDSGGAECPMPPQANIGDSHQDSADAAALDQQIEEFLQKFPATPGLAVGLVRPGENYLRGFGYRDLTSCDPVTASTTFYLLSVTKSFTGMLAALLHSEGDFDLEWTLNHFWPKLEMPAPINPAQITVRDLLLHAPGFDNGAINYRTYAPGNLDNEDLIEVLSRHSRPTSRSFAYRNTGYVIAAAAMEVALEASWQELLEEKVFEPLEMTSTTPYIDQARLGEFALPYAWTLDQSYLRRPVKREQQMHAAGGVVSNVSDLARWIRLNLDRGMLNGRRVLPARVVDQAHAPQIQLEREFYRFQRFAYGLGVYNADYEGDLLIHHFGGPIHLSFMPERGVGVVVLTNGTGPSLSFAHMIATYLYDYALGKPDLDAKYDAEIDRVSKTTLERLETRAAEYQALIDALTMNRPSRAPSAYVGTFRSDRLGDMEITNIGDRLLVRYGVITAPMIPYGEDEFLVQLEAPDLPERFRFRVDDSNVPMTLDWDGRLFERQAKPRD